MRNLRSGGRVFPNVYEGVGNTLRLKPLARFLYAVAVWNAVDRSHFAVSRFDRLGFVYALRMFSRWIASGTNFTNATITASRGTKFSAIENDL